MREVLGHFASGVTVVTAITADGPVGFTCQSFSSLSLDPPLVAFAPARTLAHLAARCARSAGSASTCSPRGRTHVSQNFARSGADKFAGVRWSPSAHGSPVLDGVVAWIDGELWAEYDGGDHTHRGGPGARPRRRSRTAVPCSTTAATYGLLPARRSEAWTVSRSGRRSARRRPGGRGRR